MLPNPNSFCFLHYRPINWEVSCWGKKKKKNNVVWKVSRLRRWCTSVPKKNLIPVKIQASFRLKMREGVIVCWCSGSCPCRSSHGVPVNLQRDKCYSLFCDVLSLYGLLKIRTLIICYPVYIRLYATFVFKMCRSSMIKHRPQSTKVKEKETDPTWSQIYSSLLHKGLSNSQLNLT